MTTTPSKVEQWKVCQVVNRLADMVPDAPSCYPEAANKTDPAK